MGRGVEDDRSGPSSIVCFLKTWRFLMIILIPPRTSQPEPGALSLLPSLSLIKTQSQATNSNKPSTSSLKEGSRGGGVVVGGGEVQIIVGLSASPSVRDTGNRNAISNHF